MATVAKNEELQAMLKNPPFRAAWDGFIDELDKGLVLIKQGAKPTGQAVGKAAQRVLDASADLPT